MWVGVRYFLYLIWKANGDWLRQNPKAAKTHGKSGKQLVVSFDENRMCVCVCAHMRAHLPGEESKNIFGKLRGTLKVSEQRGELIRKRNPSMHRMNGGGGRF